MDWLDKLEKRLRKSPKSAADAEEISEELDVCCFFSGTLVLGSYFENASPIIFLDYGILFIYFQFSAIMLSV